MAKIDILMATYNGANYLHQQVDSIFNQTETDWRLIIRDDGSTDGTPKLLADLAEKNPQKIIIINDNKGNLGPLGNFNLLCEKSDAPYCGFSDQDDLWKADKLTLACKEMEKLEKKHPEKLLMVFADRDIIDANNNIIVDSYYNHQDLKPESYIRTANMLGMCMAAGSTMLVNRLLIERSIPIPKEARMHDTWIELVATALGHKTYMNEIALSYRRHDKNVSGGQQTFKESRNIFSRAASLLKNLRYQRVGYRINFLQAKEFHKRFAEELNKQDLKDLEEFISLENINILRRLYIVVSRGMGPIGWERKLAFIVFCGKV